MRREGGHHAFAAMVPARAAYGDVVTDAYTDAVKAAGGTSIAMSSIFTPNASAGDGHRFRRHRQKPVPMRCWWRRAAPILPGHRAFTVTFNRPLDPGRGQIAWAHRLWDNPGVGREPWDFGGRLVRGARAGSRRRLQRQIQGCLRRRAAAAGLALAYDAVSLVALLAPGTPYHRFTQAALMDPNGFAGADGIFRFNPDGTSERGLAVLEVTPDGFSVADPAPKTFQAPGALGATSLKYGSDSVYPQSLPIRMCDAAEF